MDKKDQTQTDNDLLEEEDFDDLSDFSDDVDFEDDDLDLPDLDDDESWDNLGGDDLELSSEKAKNTSFVKKNFTAIVIALIALAGGLFMLGQMGSQSKNASQQEINLAETVPEINVPETPHLPVMETKTNTETLEIVLEEESLAEGHAQQNEPAALTPMPSSDETTQDLASLDFLTEGSQDNEILGESVNSLDPTEFETEIKTEIEDLNVSLETVKTAEIDVPAHVDFDFEELREDNKVLLETIALKTQDVKNAALKIENMDQKIAELQNQVSTLTLSLNQAKDKFVQQQSQKAVPASPKVTLNKKPRSAKSKAKAKPARTYKWSLRSAQPGMAVIVNAANKDMRNIEVGDHVPGLGRIGSISLKNGRWLVQGSTGRLSQ